MAYICLQNFKKNTTLFLTNSKVFNYLYIQHFLLAIEVMRLRKSQKFAVYFILFFDLKLLCLVNRYMLNNK